MGAPKKVVGKKIPLDHNTQELFLRIDADYRAGIERICRNHIGAEYVNGIVLVKEENGQYAWLLPVDSVKSPD